VLKGAGHEKKVKKVKVREEDLAPYRQSYEVSQVAARCGVGGESLSPRRSQ
jgi:hypothetical protein